MMMLPMIFSQIPARDICGMLTFRLLNTIALGGVATGSIKAKEAAIATETIRYNGWICIATANAPITGIRRDEVAVLDVISVKKITSNTTMNIMKAIFIPCKPVS